MQYNLKLDSLAALTQRYYLLLLFSVGMLLTNIVLGFGVLGALKHQKREMIPYGANTGYVISDSAVDGHFLDLMSQNFVYGRLNISPDNVKQQHQRLMRFVDASIYADFKKTLKQEADVIKDKKIASTFDIEDLHSDPKQLITDVKGLLHRHVGYRALPDIEKTYQLQYEYQFGQLHLLAFKEVKEKDHA